MPQDLKDLRSLSHDALASLVQEAGQPSFRLKQLEDWLWVHPVSSYDEMSNLPKTFRQFLATSYSVALPSQLARQLSVDGSRKYLLGLGDGVAVECVGMPSGKRLSVCVSSQAGCGIGCAFCATGAAGLTRSLSAEEIFGQVAHVARDFSRRPSSVVFMGQGEPFANYEQTLKAARRINSDLGLGIGARHITISTCGIIPMIRRFSREPEQFTLAVSLHSAVQSTRNELMPGVRKYSLLHLHEALLDYSSRTGRRPSYEYALIGGVNDTRAEMETLVEFCRDTLCHVNLITLNEVPGSPFKPSTDARARDFVRALAQAGVEATIRESRGADIDAACGQLRQRLSK